jgi:putative methyltransferase (TIGR04325 family)
LNRFDSFLASLLNGGEARPSGLRRIIRRRAPQSLRRVVRSMLRRALGGRWEMAPAGWDTPVRGWDVPTVAEMQGERWKNFATAIGGTAPLTIPYEHAGGHVVGIAGHNAAMAFAYVLMVAAHERKRLRVLDWGGGLGHYALLARAAVVDTEVDYFVFDFPTTVARGRELVEDVTFYSDRGEALSRTYDLIVASSSLWYERDWQTAIADLTRSCGDYLFVTRMGMVTDAPSFVTVQQPVESGYQTEFLCWILNESEFVSHVSSIGMELVREFLIDSGPEIKGAPERPEMRGYLFRKTRER